MYSQLIAPSPTSSFHVKAAARRPPLLQPNGPPPISIVRISRCGAPPLLGRLDASLARGPDRERLSSPASEPSADRRPQPPRHPHDLRRRRPRKVAQPHALLGSAILLPLATRRRRRGALYVPLGPGIRVALRGALPRLVPVAALTQLAPQVDRRRVDALLLVRLPRQAEVRVVDPGGRGLLCPGGRGRHGATVRQRSDSWLAGGAGTLGLDAAVFVQFFMGNRPSGD